MISTPTMFELFNRRAFAAADRESKRALDEFAAVLEACLGHTEGWEAREAVPVMVRTKPGARVNTWAQNTPSARAADC